MEQATPSRTALRVALRRAAHQIYDTPVVFVDPISVPILGPAYAEEIRRTPLNPDRIFSTAMRAFVVARSRYAEENLAQAVATGVTQYVLLGAGLDTFGYRNPYPQMRVFEVDHPATQGWKRELLTSNRIAVPASVMYVPVDFEHQTLPEQLKTRDFDHEAPTFFAMLGVVPYLTHAAFRGTLNFIAARPAGSGVVLDYGQPRSVLSNREQLAYDSLAARVQSVGEPFQLFFTPEQIAAEFSSFYNVEDVGKDEINARYFQGRADSLAVRGHAGRFLSAWL